MSIRACYDPWPQYDRRYHCGELSQTLGIHGLPQIDLWRPERD